MKKIITIIMVLCLMISVCTVSTFAASSPGTKYIKVKASTYTKYKKAYNSNKNLKTENKKLKEKLKDADGLNSWTWMSIKSLGLVYKDKVWTIPSSYPQTFMINGSTYTVRRQE